VDGRGGDANEKKDGYYIEWLIRRNGGVVFKSKMHLEREWDGNGSGGINAKKRVGERLGEGYNPNRQSIRWVISLKKACNIGGKNHQGIRG